MSRDWYSFCLERWTIATKKSQSGYPVIQLRGEPGTSQKQIHGAAAKPFRFVTCAVTNYMEQVLLEKLIVTQLVEKFRSFYGT
jgi:hypothetical protein